MTIILKPIGRGNWAPLRLVADGRHWLPMCVQVGERITIGGVTFRVCEVRA